MKIIPAPLGSIFKAVIKLLGSYKVPHKQDELLELFEVQVRP